MPRMSILSATHNGEKFVVEAMESVLNQTLGDWEHIVVDDCSDDKTYSIALDFAKRDPRFRVFRNEKRIYCANTYQRLVELANGDICGVLDGDDVLAKNATERIVGLYDKHRTIGWIYTQSWWCNDKLVPRRKGLSRLPDAGQMLKMGMRMKHCFSHWRTFRTKARDKRKPLFEPGLKCAVDKALGYVLEELGQGGFLDECLYYYRYHRENMSHKTSQRPVWKQVVEKAIKRRATTGMRSKGVIRIT